MTLITDLLSAILTLSGFFFLIAAAVGAVRLPDFFTRCHALGVTDTLGTLLILAGLAVHHGFSLVSAKLVLLILFMYFAGPAVTHVLFRAALRSGRKPLEGAGHD